MHLSAWILWLFFLLLLLLLSHREIMTLLHGRWEKHHTWLPGLLVIAALILFTIYHQSHELMSAESFPWGMVGLMFFVMILGMFAQYFYYKKPEEAFVWQRFLKPLCAAPIVFIPLVSSYQKSLIPLDAFSLAELMVLLIAFQNGFFWKMIFEKQQEKLSGDAV